MECFDESGPALINIDMINVALCTGTVPCVLKKDNVNPVLKKASVDQNLLKNFRPVSNLPFGSKLLEKIVLSQLLFHMKQNNL